MTRALPFLAGIAVIAAPAAAATDQSRGVIPAAGTALGAVQVHPYAEGTTYRLFTAPERVTDIALEPGEALVAVAAGDTARWAVGDTSSGSGDTRRVHILVKPFTSGLRTNLVITTDRRVYHLELESHPRAASSSIRWTYPHDALLALRKAHEAELAARPVAAGLALDELNFAYQIEGDRPAWRPLRAFDDGRQTYIELPAGIAVGEAPPLFLIGPEGEAQLVNYRLAGRHYVIDRLFDRAELRLGGKTQQRVRIVRTGSDRRRQGS